MPILIQLEKTNLTPGDTLAGNVHWEFDAEPTVLTLVVYWETSGKGTGDSETIFQDQWKPDMAKGDKAFRLTLPRGPISVQGNLISVRWVVECTSKKPKLSSEASFVLSHTDSFVRLHTVS